MSAPREVPSPGAVPWADLQPVDRITPPVPTGPPMVRRTGYSLHALTRAAIGPPWRDAGVLWDPRDRAGGGPEVQVWAWAFRHRDGTRIVVPWPQIHVDARGLLSHDQGPAAVWPDGWALYAWAGVPIPVEVFTAPDRLDVGQVLKARNAEVRRVMLARYPGGPMEFVRKSKCRVRHRDTDAMGPRALIELGPNEVYVVVHTRQQTGTVAAYVLRVPPHVQTCAAAVAATFPSVAQYAPAVES